MQMVYDVAQVKFSDYRSRRREGRVEGRKATSGRVRSVVFRLERGGRAGIQQPKFSDLKEEC